MNKFRLSLFCFLVLIEASCSMHVIEIQQGTIITPEMTEQLKPGMSRSQVRFVMGTPPINDPFHHERWDYVYTLKTPDGERKRRHIALFFDGDTLVTIRDSKDDEQTALQSSTD